MTENLTFDVIEARVVAWARTQPTLRGAVVVGSRARAASAADEWSDLDLILFTTQPDIYAANSAWLAQFGPVWLTHLDHTGRGEPEWYALYAGGLKVDFVLHAVGPALAQAALAALIATSHYQSVFQRGVRAIFDRAAPEAPLAPPFQPAHPQPPAPTAEQFDAEISSALFAAARAALLLRRGDLWRVKYQADHILKQHLLTMLVWQARARNEQAEIWDDGRHMQRWADPGALAALPATFAAYDVADQWRGLFATLELYRSLAHQTAERLGLPALHSETAVLAWLQNVRSEAQKTMTS